jgi:hypothetical protein
MAPSVTDYSGEWRSVVAYSPGKLVSYLEAYYIAMSFTIGNVPASGTPWAPLTIVGPIGPAGGPTGPSGATGTQGATGVQGERGFIGFMGATGLTGATGPVGKGFRVFSLVNSSNELPIATDERIGEFVLVVGGELYVYTEACYGSTGPGTRYSLVGNIGDSPLTGPSGNMGATGPAGATGTFDGTVPFIVSVPASINSIGTAGTIAYDTKNMYKFVAANTWSKIALTTF